ncbi:paraquat-inducible protein A [Sedimentitalea nanhaiensis]|uniref:Paraquat-inducible protein A n=1 Tax=Sedimentitalea nanhaiensis TaxID=999627 RepID=A0A1I6ZIG0_9RHOB|nr:paraquat-inducible protein A [Sedimentitalea nanhaiensis]SFT62492.1 paraquat-inducible protein A [Sedimentitalea nanhaiensis]
MTADAGLPAQAPAARGDAHRAGSAAQVLTARDAGLVACTGCGRVYRATQARCRRCGARLSSRDETSLQRVWAWWLAGLIAYIPANLYPMLKTTTMGHELSSTIVGGVIELIDYQSYSVAVIVFTASVVIPICKFIAIAFLAYSVQFRRGRGRGGLARQHLYEMVEFIGRWSMIDVFVVAILSSLVQFQFVASIHPGIAAVSFALSVAFTMLSAQSFDSRLIWDADEAEDT